MDGGHWTALIPAFDILSAVLAFLVLGTYAKSTLSSRDPSHKPQPHILQFYLGVALTFLGVFLIRGYWGIWRATYYSFESLKVINEFKYLAGFASVFIIVGSLLHLHVVWSVTNKSKRYQATCIGIAVFLSTIIYLITLYYGSY